MIAKQSALKKERRDILVFTIMDEEMAFDIACVREVLKPREIRPLVHAPAFVEGVITIRNYVLLVVSLRKRFGIRSTEGGSRERIIICKVNNMIIGLIVDSVIEVLDISGLSMQPPPSLLSMESNGRYVTGLIRAGERLITLLDLGKILTPEELTRLSEIGS